MTAEPFEPLVISRASEKIALMAIQLVEAEIPNLPQCAVTTSDIGQSIELARQAQDRARDLCRASAEWRRQAAVTRDQAAAARRRAGTNSDD